MRFTSRLIEAYEKYALERNEGEAQEFKEREKEMFLNYLGAEPGKSLLEIGCGPGHDARSFQEKGFDVFAIVNAPTMVKLCREKGVAADLLDSYDLDQIERTFDAVFSMNCLLHIPGSDLPRILDLIRAKMNDGGLFYLGIWGGDDFEGIWEGDRYEPKRFFSLHRPKQLLEYVQRVFTLVYYRRIEPWDSAVFNSMILRKDSPIKETQ